MIGKWSKLGILFDPSRYDLGEKLFSHAANPVACHLYDDIYRIYYSGRDKEKRSSVGAVDIDIINRKIITIHKAPFFTFGQADSFYSEGVSIGCIKQINSVNLIYFMGWKNKPDRHWYGQIGALVVDSNFNLSLLQDSPVLSLTDTESLSLSYPCVINSKDGAFEMWFGSTKSWDVGNSEMLHVLQSASSYDGINWVVHDEFIPFEIGVAQAFSRPTCYTNVQHVSDHMWFSFRSGSGETYRIGRADRFNYGDWCLSLDDQDIEPSETGWDSKMIEYPYVFQHKAELYMLYNGNDYGRSGFGLARWVSSF